MTESGKIIIATRKSKLALWQSEHIRERLMQAHPGLEIELNKITTTGDKILDAPLAKIGDKGLFTKQIESALLAGEADLAVHSLKDLPTSVEPGLAIGAITEREDPLDAFIGKTGTPLYLLPPGATIATSSLRRRAQLLNHKPGLNLVDIRGNVDTRLAKLAENPDLDGIILAKAGLTRMGLAGKITQVLHPEVMLPAVGQGALGIEIRDKDERISRIVSMLENADSRVATTAERTLLARLEGGCQIPIGALGIVKNGELSLTAMVASLDGKRLVRDFVSGPSDQAQNLGEKLAEKLIDQGADEILKEIVAQSRSAQ